MKHNITESFSRPLPCALRSVAIGLLCCGGLIPAPLTAEDSDEMRPYMSVRRGEFNHRWGVQDMSGISLGLNFNRYLGAELAVDQWQSLMDDPTTGRALGEEAATSLIPALRLRYPLFEDRLVPYIIGGFGGSFHQFNDRKSSAYGRYVEADGWGWAASIGAGVDWFVADNLALNLEVKQVWHSSEKVTVDNRSFTYDPSDWCATIGFRVFFEENDPKPLLGNSEGYPTRFFLGLSAGGTFTTDGGWSSGVEWEPNAPAWGNFIQYFGGSVGADFGPNWGFELTAGGGECNVHVDGIGTICEYAIAPIIAQVRLRMPAGDGRWVPYFTGGFGVCYSEANDYKAAEVGHAFEADGIYPAFNLGGGIEYFIARNVSFSAETRWMYTWDHKFQLDGATARGDFSHIECLLVLRMYLVEL